MRYTSHSEDDIKKMLDVIGKSSIEELFDGIPNYLKFSEELNLPEPLCEWELNNYFDNISSKGFQGHSFLGAGSYNHHIPSIVPYITSRSEFLTSYTPYQPEISLGTLQAQFEFQTYISEYLGMEFSNASMYDGATSFVEAVLLSIRVTKRKKILVSKAINPRYLEVLKTYAEAVGFEILTLECSSCGKTNLDSIPDLTDIASISIQSPNYFGVIEDNHKIKPIVSSGKTLFVSLFTEILAFGLYKPPGEYGADIACGEAQSFGVSQSFGGPSLGVFAFNKKHLRSIPGRVVGQTIDKRGDRSFCLTLATREQHIRRDKATSNICSNEGLCVLSAIVYLSLLGGRGLKKLAKRNYNNSEYLKEGLKEVGCEVMFESPGFNEFVVRFPDRFNEKKIRESGFIPGLNLNNHESLKGCYLIAVTEVFNKETLDQFISIIGGSDDL